MMGFAAPVRAMASMVVNVRTMEECMMIFVILKLIIINRL